jgi:transposase
MEAERGAAIEGMGARLGADGLGGGGCVVRRRIGGGGGVGAAERQGAQPVRGCGRRSPGDDGGEGRRGWRALGLGTTKVFIEADAPRVRCRAHGPTVIAVPWGRHGAGHTRDFDDLAAWLAVRTSTSAVCELLRIAWRSVGSIVTRVNADVDARVDRLDGLRRIGIDEISYKRGHRYLIVVVDHDTGRLVWAGPGRNDTALGVFFDQRGAERAAQLTHVSADMADWIARVVARRAPNAVRCADPFHVVAWAIDPPRHRTPPCLERGGWAATDMFMSPATP